MQTRWTLVSRRAASRTYSTNSPSATSARSSSATSPRSATSADGFAEVLRESHRYRLAYLATHGNCDDGLSHALQLSDDRWLAAADLLAARLPRLVVLASCWSGAVRGDPARETLGLATMCLARGADSVIASAVPLNDERGSEVLADALRRLASGAAPGQALREAQQWYLDDVPDALLGDWAPLCVIGRP